MRILFRKVNYNHVRHDQMRRCRGNKEFTHLKLVSTAAPTETEKLLVYNKMLDVFFFTEHTPHLFKPFSFLLTGSKDIFN